MQTEKEENVSETTVHPEAPASIDDMADMIPPESAMPAADATEDLPAGENAPEPVPADAAGTDGTGETTAADAEILAPAVGIPDDIDIGAAANPDDDGGDDDESGDPPQPLDAIVEAIVFASPEPLSALQVVNKLKTQESIASRQVEEIIGNLNRKYHAGGHAFEIVKIAEEYRYMTRPEFGQYLALLRKAPPRRSFSDAALQTLAIVAYRQPITKAEIDGIRGVQCGQLLKSLLEKDMVKIVGVANEIGNPRLYGTTKRFLEVFGIGSLKDLPRMEDFNE